MAIRRSRDATRISLIEAAEALIGASGLDAINSNQIAKAAGVGVGTFYSHFEDKSALLRAITLLAWEQLGQAMAATSSAGQDDAAGMTRAVVDYATANPARFRIAFGRGTATANAAAGQPAMTLSTRPVERRLAELQKSGALAAELDPAVAARAWWAMVSGTLLWWLEDPKRSDPAMLVRTLTLLHPARSGAPGRSAR
jgi:AcrR family transcriptional regulator